MKNPFFQVNVIHCIFFLTDSPCAVPGTVFLRDVIESNCLTSPHHMGDRVDSVGDSFGARGNKTGNIVHYE